jgi:hypothetical protein
MLKGRSNQDMGVRMSGVYDQKEAALQKFTEAGADHNCPFCQARMVPKRLPGDRILFLKGRRAGYSATVSARPSPIEGEFLVHMDGEPDEWQRRVSYGRDLFVGAPLQLVPNWMCPFSMKDLCALEDAALCGTLRAFELGAQTIRVEVAQTLDDDARCFGDLGA